MSRQKHPNQFYVTFQLDYAVNNGGAIKNVFYSKRDLNRDFDKLFELISTDSLFCAHKCEIEKDFDQFSCTVYVLGWDLSPDNPSGHMKFISHALDNKLVLAGLYDHFYVSQKFCSPDPVRKTTFSISYNPNNLINAAKTSNNQKELDELGFPQDKIPDQYCCALMSEVMDIPYCDLTQDYEHPLEYRVIMRHVRDHHTNPFTKTTVLPNTTVYHYSLWDKIETFMEKVRLVHAYELNFSAYMKEIQNEGISSIELQTLLGKSSSKDVDQTREAIQAALGKRFINAAYLLKRTLESNPSQNNANQLKVSLALALFKSGNFSEASEEYEALTQLSLQPDNEEFAVLLTQVANYRLNCAETKEDFKSVHELASRAVTIFSSSADRYPSYDRDAEIILCKQVLLLSSLNCKNNHSERCKALRMAAVHESSSLLGQCLALLVAQVDAQDNNPTKGFTALHLALENNRLENAWLLAANKCSFDVKSARGVDGGGKTCRELLEASTNPRMKKLLKSFIIIRINSSLIDDNRVAALINSRIPQIKNAIGLTDEVDVIYLAGPRKIIIADFYLLHQMHADFVRYVAFSLQRIPGFVGEISLQGLDLDVCNRGVCPYQNLTVEFIISSNQITLRNEMGGRNLNANILFNPPAMSRDDIYIAVSKALHALSELFGTPCVDGHTYFNHSAGYGRFGVSFVCKTAPYLKEYLLAFIRGNVNKSRIGFHCIDIQIKPVQNLETQARKDNVSEATL